MSLITSLSESLKLLARGAGAVIALGGLTDEKQSVGRLARCSALFFVVTVDEPLPGIDGLFQLAAQLEQPRLHPACAEFICVELHGASRSPPGRLPSRRGRDKDRPVEPAAGRFWDFRSRPP